MRTTFVHRCAGALSVAAAALLLSAGPAAADTASPAPSPSESLAPVTSAGSSFLTATAVQPGQPVQLAGSIGDYLYWSFTSVAGRTDKVAITVTLPPRASRHGASSWAVDVFDGLRRRQACTAGAQTPTAKADAASVTLGCTLRQVRAWAEPWSGDPLPGTYYVRLAVTELPEQDLGLPMQVAMRITAHDSDDTQPEGGELKTPLTQPVAAGTVQTSAPPVAAEEKKGIGWSWDWLPDLSTRWAWTAAGGAIAAVTGVGGYSLTRHPRRRRRSPEPDSFNRLSGATSRFTDD
ncbi:peptidase [Microtetraspora niveoalba]|uniref:peptidase n=1 Tax=Microtetraspora niveoalba TaxID=46175 RepID=UPI0008334808|nr:peptidase [Microtetraspora niveoalba]